MSGKRVKKNIFYLGLVQISNYIFPLLTFPYLSRVLGPEGFGKIALAQSIILYMTSFVDFGFNLTSTRRISLYHNEGSFHKINEVMTDTYISKLILLIFSFIICIILSITFSQLNNVFTLLLVGYLSVLGSVAFPVWLFQGMQVMKGIVITTTTAKLVSLIFIFLLVKNEDDIIYAMLATSLGGVLSGIISLAYVYHLKGIRFVKIDFTRALSLVKEAYPIFLSFVGASIYTTLNSFVLSFFVPVYAIGIYSGADKIKSVAQSMMVPLQQAIYPHFSALVTSKENFRKGLLKYGIVLFLLSFLISIFLAFFSPQIIHLILGSKFDSSFKVLFILSPLPMIISCAIIFGQWGLVNLGKGKVLSKIYMYCAIIHISHICILAYIWGIYGAAISVVLTETIVTICITIAFFKEYKQWI